MQNKYENNYFCAIFYSISRYKCSKKGQLEKTRSWKVQNEIEKNEVGKFLVILILHWKLSNFDCYFLTSDFPT